MNYIELKQIDELIKSGFDLESISFELGIPKEKLNNYINKYRSMNNTSNTIERKKLLSKINKLKKKYNNLFYADYSNIEDEISERQKNSSANNKLSSEKIKNQIFIQVKTLLKEQPTNYSIKNPNKTVEQLQQLTNIDITQSLQIVTTNLINEKSYEKAKILCDDFLKATRDDALKDTIYTMKKNIRNYEIGDMVLKGLSMDKSDDKQIEYFELIEKGLIKGNVKLSSIPLGTSKDGLKKIYLSDIMDINELER